MITKDEVYPLPNLGVEPHLIKNFFSESMFEDVKKQIKETGMGTENGSYHTMMGRWAAGIAPNKDIEEYALNEIRKIFNNDTLVPAYHYTVMYQRKDGCIPNLWEHLDQNGSQISINIAIENTANWPLIVEGKKYYQNPNDAVIFCGQQHMHARPPYPTKDETANTTQLFMHYSTPDHWIQTNKNGIHEFGQDGDIRFFNRNRYFPLPDPPVNQPIGSDQDYSSVLRYYNDIVGHAKDSEPETVDMTILTKEELAPGITKYKIAKESTRILKGLIQNSMFKQWMPAKSDSGTKAMYNYFLTEKQNDCHPQDPIRRAAESLQIGLDAIAEDSRPRYSERPLVSSHTVLLRYEEENTFYSHIDNQPGNPRVLSVLMFLNDDFEGGELEFKEFNIKIKPEAGDVIAFCSAFPYIHQVHPIITGIRYSVIKWYEFTR